MAIGGYLEVVVLRELEVAASDQTPDTKQSVDLGAYLQSEEERGHGLAALVLGQIKHGEAGSARGGAGPDQLIKADTQGRRGVRM